MTHTQTIPNLVVIDREWLIDKISLWENYWQNTDGKKEGEIFDVVEELKSVLNNSYPLSPIVEDAWGKSYERSLENTTILTCQTIDMYDYLSQPIKLVK